MICKSNNNSYHDSTSAFLRCIFPKKIRNLMPLSSSSVSWDITLMNFLKIFRLLTTRMKIHQICTLIVSFCWKYIKFQPRKCRGAMFHDHEECCKVWRKTDLSFQKWHVKFDEFWPDHSKVSKFALWWLIMSKLYKVWLKKFQRIYVSWHWTVMQNLSNSLFVVAKMTWGFW